MQAALTLLRRAIFLPPLLADLQNSYRQVEHVTPDSEDFGSLLGSLALDTCCALLSAFDFIVEGNDQSVLDVATFARNTVDMYVQEIEEMDPNDPDLEAKIDRHQYMMREVKWQRAALAQLTSIEQPSSALLDKLIQEQMLDLELLPEEES